MEMYNITWLLLSRRRHYLICIRMLCMKWNGIDRVVDTVI